MNTFQIFQVFFLGTVAAQSCCVVGRQVFSVYLRELNSGFLCWAMANGVQSQEGLPGNLSKQLAVAVRSIQWSYAIFWSLSAKQQGYVTPFSYLIFSFQNHQSALPLYMGLYTFLSNLNINGEHVCSIYVTLSFFHFSFIH